ncbi:DNA mismatch repair protein MutS, partial [Staphylococcus delphini]
MTSNTFFILLLVVALVGMTLITETVRRIRHQRMLTYHLEHFTRFDTTENPHAIYDAYFKSQHIAKNMMIDDKTWSDLSMDLVFDKLNATYTSMGENHLYSALRLQTPLVHYEFLEQLRKHPNQHREIVKRLVDIGKSIYPNYDKDIFEQQYQGIYAFLLAMPFVGMVISFFNFGTGLLWICFAFFLNIIVSFRYNYYVEKDLKQLFIMGRVVRETEILSK